MHKNEFLLIFICIYEIQLRIFVIQNRPYKKMKNLIALISFIFLFLGVGIESFGQDADKPDLRDGSCVICRGNAAELFHTERLFQ
jgi:hypothetical protein